MADDWTEIAIFLHGMTPDNFPQIPLAEYDHVRQGMVRYMWGNDPFTGDSITPVWNFQPIGFSDRPSFDVAVVSRNTNSRIDKMEKAAKGINWNPVRLFAKLIKGWSWVKRLYYNGIGDVFYYLSVDGEREVRREIMEQIYEKLVKSDEDKKGKFSMTVFAHSAGSVIAHDMLFHLFSPKRLPIEDHETERALEYIRENYVDTGRLRVRKFFTSGSPLAPLMIRSRKLLDIMKDDCARLDPADLGLTSQYSDIDPDKPRWINFWDRGDVLGAPLADFYDADRKIVRDEIFPVSLWPGKAHTGYWLNHKVLRIMAENWK